MDNAYATRRAIRLAELTLIAHRGYVDVQLLRLTLPRHVEQFYVCGPRAMLESVVPALEEWGVPPQQIHYEAFAPASLTRQPVAHEAPARPVTVSFSESGRELPWASGAGTLLDFAEANGVSIESGCRAGSCGSCQTRIEEGEVDYIQTPGADIEAGTGLPCIALPKTNLTLVA